MTSLAMAGAIALPATRADAREPTSPPSAGRVPATVQPLADLVGNGLDVIQPKQRVASNRLRVRVRGRGAGVQLHLRIDF